MGWDNIHFIFIMGMVLTGIATAILAQIAIKFRDEIDTYRKLSGEIGTKEALEEKIKALREVKEDLIIEEHEAKMIINQKEDAERTRDELEDLNELMREEIEALKPKHEEVESLSGQIAGLTEQIESADLEISEKQDAIKDLQVAVEGYESEKQDYESLQTKIGEIEEQITEASREIETLESKVAEKAEVEDAIAELESAKGDLEAELEGLKQSFANTQSRIDSNNREIEERGLAETGNDPCTSLWDPVFDKEETAPTDTEEQDKLEHVYQTLIDVGVRIHRRLLYAFHTSLKNQDISPLTILAGVSGTGKSLIPTQYAKIIGINFLNMPVQPGWNSPDDLFGFFNYMEKKFDATSFSRALVQFDNFNRGKWEERIIDHHQKEGNEPVENINEQICMVLLDEMNLARIEYYFSDLISKLEMRRNIGTYDDDDERRQCEHLIKVVGDKEIPLFIGENILFTGTMNEDESTLSLSDKVLDRSSIIRFGQPNELVNYQPDLDQIEGGAKLTRDTWKSWCEENEIQQEMLDIKDELAEIMASIGNPFGQRVSLSIIQYIRHYPGAQEHAMSDQIEQKILPKLRGLDKERVLAATNKLVTILEDKLEDAELAAAIQSGITRSSDAFIWNGLDRAEG